MGTFRNSAIKNKLSAITIVIELRWYHVLASLNKDAFYLFKGGKDNVR